LTINCYILVTYPVNREKAKKRGKGKGTEGGERRELWTNSQKEVERREWNGEGASSLS